MKQSSRVVAIVIVLTASLPAEEPAKKAEALKPQWQRYLQGADAKKAAEQEKKLAQLQEAGQFGEALKVAEELASLRAKKQGADHWQSIDARSLLEVIRRVQKAQKEEQQSYSRVFTLQRQANALKGKGHYQEAQPLLEQILAVCRKLLGEEHALTATGYNNVAYIQNMQGKYQQAEEGYRKALAIRRKVLGEEHPHTAGSYSNLAGARNSQGKYKEAEGDECRAMAIRRKVLGEEHSDTAASYNGLAYNQHSQSRYVEAAENYRKALTIWRKLLGEEHANMAVVYNNLGVVLDAQSKHKEAAEVHRKALAIRRKVLGEEHPDTAKSYNNLAVNLFNQDKYKEAEEDLRKALAIWRKRLGEEHPLTATCYNNVASMLNAQGKFQAAEQSHRKALVIRRKVLGEEHPDTAQSYNNIALNLRSQSKYKEAEEGFRKALAIWLKVLGEEHTITATSYNNLGYILQDQRKYPEAEEDLRKALAIRRRVLGEENPETAASYDNVAANLDEQGKYQEAEEGHRKALAIRRKVLGEENRLTATSYHNLAGNLNVQGKYSKAEEYYYKALAIIRKLLGDEHPDTATSYQNLAKTLYDQGKYQEAEKLWRSAANVFSKARLHIAASGLERAANTGEQSSLPALAAVLARNGKPAEAWQRYEETLSRGTWDDVSAQLRRPQAERDNQAQITARIDRLQKLIERASVPNAPPALAKQREELLGQLRQSYVELAAFTQQLEKKYGPIAGQLFSRGKIQASLPADAAIIGWLDILGAPKAADPNGEHWAILLRSSGDPIWMRLHGSGDKGAWTDADTQLPGQLRTALHSSTSEWQPLAERIRQQRLQPLDAHLKGVKHLIVLPSIALAAVPIEVLAEEWPTRSASRDAVAERLHHKFTVSYAHSGTMYAHLRQQQPTTSQGLFALADPVFELPVVAEKAQPLPPSGVLLTMVAPNSNAFRAGLRTNDVLLRYGDTDLSGPADLKPLREAPDSAKDVPVIVWRDGVARKQPFYLRPGKLGVIVATDPAPQALAERRRLDRWVASRGGDDGNWKRLPGTRVEAAALQRLFGSASAQVLMDSEASEQRLDALAKSGALGQYRYIHLATHGEVNDSFPLRSAVILARDRLPDDKQRTDLLISGQPIPDGCLTAEEVLRRWNLHADLVTLSACQTALGKYERGEGFVGFAQALVLSGSRSVCLSLWKVNDTATALLMERFYQNLLGKRDGVKAPMSKATALAEAKEWLRTLPREEVVKRAASLSHGAARGKDRPLAPPLEVAPAATAKKDSRPFSHPYYWAAFVLVGHSD